MDEKDRELLKKYIEKEFKKDLEYKLGIYLDNLDMNKPLKEKVLNIKKDI